MAGSIPQYQSDDPVISKLQDAIVPPLNKLLQNPVSSAVLLRSVSLKAGANVVNHGLDKRLQGWSVVRLRAAAVIYDTQDANPFPTKTLFLNSSVAVIVDLLVF